ncbi:D-glycero-beta-D-manno-heptose 1-phosphate adenylyltransferase [Dendrosporobacter sp. 1207_IL3150]|uniref:D-glycero-beta-D-manno-heptose 1-phosphate adenylyltransferase n=1 Tax=Dendrosporobacter sp. 1207_IL3150 TaxID=3084054 RepID=UPI002FD930FE
MKIVNREQLTAIVEDIKAAGKTVVFTNGCFDILHVGHVRYLQAARELGDCLVIGLNSDSSVRGLKGPTRPINNQADRAEVLAALASVDYIIVFDEPTAKNLIANFRPQIYVKGGDYKVEAIPEAEIVSNYGGQTMLVPEVQGRSSTAIITKIIKDKSNE